MFCGFELDGDVKKHLLLLPTFGFGVCLGNPIGRLNAITDSETQRRKAYLQEFLSAAARLKPLHSPILFKIFLNSTQQVFRQAFSKTPTSGRMPP